MKIPLSLFEFRIFIKYYKIEFESPKNINLYDLPDLITKEIMANLGSRDFNLSHLVGFLLSNVPSFVKKTFYSEYVRDNIINMITMPKNENIRQEMIRILKDMIQPLIKTISGKQWEITIVRQLNFNPDQKTILNFLANPWRHALQIIDHEIRPEYSQKINEIQKRHAEIKKVIDNLTSDTTISNLNKCIKNDIASIKQEVLQSIDQNIIPEDQLNSKRIEFSKHAKLFYDLIPELPQINMDRSCDPFVSGSFFDSFYDFMVENNTRTISRNSHTIFAIIPERKNSNFVRTLIYTYRRHTYTVTFKTLGKVMLFKPPDRANISLSDIYTRTDSCVILNFYFNNVIGYDSSSLAKLSNSFNSFTDLYNRYQENEQYIAKKRLYSRTIDQTKVLFGDKDIVEFKQKLIDLKVQSENNSKSIFHLVEFIQNFNQEMTSMKNITFLKTIKPPDTIKFISNILTNINFTNINFHNYLFRLEHDTSFRNECEELDDLMNKSINLSFRLTDEQNRADISDEDIKKIQKEILSAPLIFKEGDSLKVSSKTIEVTCDPLILGIDLAPLIIRLPNLTNDEILCEFHQINNELPLPTFKNENGILIIEISTETLYKNALNNQANSNDKEIDAIFKFEGTILMKAKSNPDLKTEIEYSITLHYVSFTAFILMKNNHYFAIKNDKIEIVPFVISSNSKIVFEKFYSQECNKSHIKNKISQLDDDNATVPCFLKSRRSKDIIIVKYPSILFNLKKFHSSINLEFGLENEKSITASFHADILPPITLAIFSDETQNFEKENIIINVGNLTRKVYFVVELFNFNKTKEAKISNVDIRTNDRDNLIFYSYDPYKNFHSIPPNQYGYIICFFEVRYSGPIPLLTQNNIIDSTLIVEFEGKSSTINFKYMIQSIQIQDSFIKYCGNKNNFYYNDLQNKKFVLCDIDEISKNSTFRGFEEQVLISPFSYSLFTKKNEYIKVSYDVQKGKLIKISNGARKKIEYEVFCYSFDENKFKIESIDDPKQIYIHKNNKEIYILARIKNDPDSYFPLFCPIKRINTQFDLSKKIELKYIFYIFIRFFRSMMYESDFEKLNHKSLYSLFNSSEFLTLQNFSYLIDLVGKKRKSISFKKVIISISKFTNCYEIKDNFNQIIYEYGEKSKNIRFYAFVSVLNKLINDCFIYLQEKQFYIKSPIDFSIIKKVQNIILNKAINDESKDICKYINEAKARIKKVSKYEQEKKKEYEENGFTVTQILKWDQKNGLTASNIDELNSYKQIQKKSFTKKVQVKNPLLEKLILNSLGIASIKSAFQQFNDLYHFEYFIPNLLSMLFHKNNFDQIRDILNYVLKLYSWQTENSFCFPFYPLKIKFNNILELIMSKFNISQLNIGNFPRDLMRQNYGDIDFVQTPKLGYEQNDDPDILFDDDDSDSPNENNENEDDGLDNPYKNNDNEYVENSDSKNKYNNDNDTNIDKDHNNGNNNDDNDNDNEDNDIDNEDNDIDNEDNDIDNEDNDDDYDENDKEDDDERNNNNDKNNHNKGINSDSDYDDNLDIDAHKNDEEIENEISYVKMLEMLEKNDIINNDDQHVDDDELEEDSYEDEEFREEEGGNEEREEEKRENEENEEREEEKRGNEEREEEKRGNEEIDEGWEEEERGNEEIDEWWEEEGGGEEDYIEYDEEREDELYYGDKRFEKVYIKI